jgi:hypothetical protein
MDDRVLEQRDEVHYSDPRFGAIEVSFLQRHALHSDGTVRGERLSFKFTARNKDATYAKN